MKKPAFWAGILALVFTACSVSAAAPGDTGNDTTVPMASSAQEESTALASSAQAVSESKPAAGSSKPTQGGDAPAPRQASGTEAATPAGQPPAKGQPSGNTTTASPPPVAQASQPNQSPAAPPTAAPQPAPPPAPAPATMPPLAAPQTAPAPAHTPPPAPPPAAFKTAYDAPYDIGAIIAEAAAYGGSLGMAWSDGLNTGNCSWEAPITTSASLCGDRLKEAIQSGIRRVQTIQQDNGYQPGEFLFKLSCEATGGGEYTLYFLMG